MFNFNIINLNYHFLFFDWKIIISWQVTNQKINILPVRLEKTMTTVYILNKLSELPHFMTHKNEMNRSNTHLISTSIRLNNINAERIRYDKLVIEYVKLIFNYLNNIFICIIGSYLFTYVKILIELSSLPNRNGKLTSTSK